jgi:hypothetical protein
MVHEGKWQLVRADDGRMLAIPPTVRFGVAAASRPDPPPEPFGDEGIDGDAGYDSSS